VCLRAYIYIHCLCVYMCVREMCWGADLSDFFFLQGLPVCVRRPSLCGFKIPKSSLYGDFMSEIHKDTDF
jgi:hypothetical protein